jgi:hypothetical protein
MKAHLRYDSQPSQVTFNSFTSTLQFFFAWMSSKSYHVIKNAIKLYKLEIPDYACNYQYKC